MGTGYGGRSILCRHDWPGNIRELENIAERVSVLLQGNAGMKEVVDEVVRELFGNRTGMLSRPSDLAGEVEDWERQRILQVLREVDGSRTRAAQLLGINRSTLWRKLKDYEIKS